MVSIGRFTISSLTYLATIASIVSWVRFAILSFLLSPLFRSPNTGTLPPHWLSGCGWDHQRPNFKGSFLGGFRAKWLNYRRPAKTESVDCTWNRHCSRTVRLSAYIVTTTSYWDIAACLFSFIRSLVLEYDWSLSASWSSGNSVPRGIMLSCRSCHTKGV